MWFEVKRFILTLCVAGARTRRMTPLPAQYFVRNVAASAIDSVANQDVNRDGRFGKCARRTYSKSNSIAGLATFPLLSLPKKYWLPCLDKPTGNIASA